MPVSIIIIKYYFPAFQLGFTDSTAFLDQHSKFQDIFVCSWIKTCLTVCSGESDLSRVFSFGISLVVSSKWAFVCVRKIAQCFLCRNWLKGKELLQLQVHNIIFNFQYDLLSRALSWWRPGFSLVFCWFSALCPWASPFLTLGLACLVRLWSHQTMGCVLPCVWTVAGTKGLIMFSVRLSEHTNNPQNTFVLFQPIYWNCWAET